MKNPFALSDSKRSYLVKLFELVLALATVFFVSIFFAIIISNIQPIRWLLPTQHNLIFENLFVYVFPVLLLVGCPIAAYFWYRKENAGNISSDRSHAAVRGFLRWGLAFVLIFFSLLLFVFPLLTRWPRVILDDMSTSRVSSNYLFEYLLLRSEALRIFLSGSFVLSALLLFFKRTTFIGLVIGIFTMLLLLTLWATVGSAINKFNVEFVMAAYAFVTTAYLFMINGVELRSKITGIGQTTAPVAGIRFRWAMLLLVMVSVGLLYRLTFNEMNKNSQLMGKWKVRVLERNGTELPSQAWMSDDGAWTTVYIDSNDGLRFCSNPYTFDQGASFYGKYELDAKTGLLSISSLRNYDGPILFRVEGLGKSELSWKGKVGKDEVRMVLTKVL